MRSMFRIASVATAIAGAAALLPAQSCWESTFGTSIGNGDDAVLAIQPIGFAFPFAGTTYTDVHVSTNGFLYLSNAGTPTPGGPNCCTGTAATLIAGTAAKICPLWHDLNLSTANGAACYLNSATPGRTVITWDRAVEFGNTVLFSMQCHLYATGEIDFIYNGAASVIRTTGDALVGMSPANGAANPGATNLSAGASTTVPTVYELFNNGALPLDIGANIVQFFPNASNGFDVVPGGCPAASNTSYGTGCYLNAQSFYELFAQNTFDLSGSTVTLFPTGPGYLVSSAAPVSSYFTPVSTAFTLTDDSLTAAQTLPAAFPHANGSTTSIRIHSNGQVFLGTGGTADFSPTVTEFLTRPASVGAWMDFNPGAAGSGGIHLDIDTTAMIAYVSWNGVYAFGTTTPMTWQVALFLTGSSNPGMVELRFQSLMNSSTAGSPVGEMILGYSRGGTTAAPAANPGNRDFSATMPFVSSTSSTESFPLALAAAPSPVIGSSIVYTTSNIPSTSLLSALILSLGQVNPFGPIPGAPGCGQGIDLNGSATFLMLLNPTDTVTFAIPNNPAYAGFSLFAQSVSVVPGVNALNAITSNAQQSFVNVF